MNYEILNNILTVILLLILGFGFWYAFHDETKKDGVDKKNQNPTIKS